MTSEERHEARYQRRKQHREQKRRESLREANDFEKVIGYRALFEATQKCRRGVYWKDSVKSYYCYALLNNPILHTRQKKGLSCHRKTNHFTITERGHLRHIQSHKFSERVLQTALNENALAPMLNRSLIYDNGASQKGKGTDFAADRLEDALHRYYDLHGNNRGYIMLLDFHNYFGSIVKVQCLDDLQKVCEDPRLFKAMRQEIEPDGPVGLGLGSPMHQTLAIHYTNDVDHKMDNTLGIEGVGVYMDDRHAIASTRQILIDAAKAAAPLWQARGIELNLDKSKIVPIWKPFKFCQTRYVLTETGAVLRLPVHKKTSAERRKLKKQRRLWDEGKITDPESIRGGYLGWRANYEKKNARRTVRMTDGLYNKLFVIPKITRPINGGKKHEHRVYHR